MVALIRFFYKKNPEELTIDEYCRLRAELHYLSELGVLNIRNNG